MEKIVWDQRSEYVYSQVNEKSFAVLHKKYRQFIKDMGDPTTTPISVYNLKPKQLEELQLIRDVSKHLQKKKEDDMNKAKADAEAAIKKEEDKQEEKSAEENAAEEKTAEEKTADKTEEQQQQKEA
ncbi:hypothetical protein evm_000877 [Chilo suppressalis]|nr:hypothetical protein evm_000877 [Chilo suppressalis]